jgi:hypothetical protein
VKATGSRAKSATVPATVDDMVKHCEELIDEDVEASVTAAAQETLALLAEYGDDTAHCKMLVDNLNKLAIEARKVHEVESAAAAPGYAIGRWPCGVSCGDKTAKGRKCGRKDGCSHRTAAAEQDANDAKAAKIQKEMDTKDGYWKKMQEAKGDSVRCWAG